MLAKLFAMSTLVCGMLGSPVWAGNAPAHDSGAGHQAAGKAAHGSEPHDAAGAGAVWDYGDEHGPGVWGSLSPDYALCSSGTRQSPVNLTRPFQASFSRLQFEWRATSWNVVNNGHTIQLEGENAGDLVIEERPYALQGVHFHAPSEHTINGRHFPMEAHFVHKDEDGRLAVLAVMVEIGERNSIFRSIMRIAPESDGTASLGLGTIIGLVPMRSRFYRYFGSLTTPPCSEGVLWTVLEDPITATEDDIERFTDLYSANARPVQPLMERFLLAN